ncbi:MAG: hypothetical protein IT445_15665 [Phycisphaeraceae bacterium]|nr:hypothetical protein [Phycisphaeraceae bacterium]
MKRNATVSRQVIWLIVLLVCSTPAFCVQMQNAGMTGTRIYRDGAWAQLGCTLSNASASDDSGLVVLTLRGMNQTQFAAEPWVPAGAQRQVRFAFYLTADASKDERSWPARTQLIERTAAGERQAAVNELLLLLHQDAVSTVTIVDNADEARAGAARRIVRALRTDDKNLSPATSGLSQGDAPEQAAGWDAVDTLLIAADPITLEPAQLQALRHWLLKGGRLWIMLDMTPPKLGEALLGEAWKLAVLDTIELTQFDIEASRRSEALQFDYPVHLTRVVAEDWEISHTVRGYPVVLRKQVGRGEVLLTTLEARAWFSQDDQDKPLAGNSLKALRWWMQPSPHRQHQQQQLGAFEPMVSQQIGYRVLGLAPVAGVLGLYLLAMLGAGFYLMRQERLQWLSAAGIVLALITAALLVVLGWSRQSQCPTTLAVAQIAHYADDVPAVLLDDRLSIYRAPNQNRDDDLLLRGQGGLAWPSLAAQGGQIMRFMQDENEHWVMHQLQLPSGAVSNVSLTQGQALSEAVYASIGWDSNGQLRGRIVGPAADALEDAMLSSHDGRTAVRFTEPGSFVEDGPLRDQQFMQSTVLNQKQQARLQVYRNLFADPKFLETPRLLGWSDALSSGLELGQDVARQSDALLTLPIRYERPSTPGSLIQLPFALLSMSMLRHVEGVQSASLFAEETRKFVDTVQQSGELAMRFDVPAALMPLQLQKLEVYADITALGRQVDLVVYRGNQLVAVRSIENPNQSYTFTLEADDLPTLFEEGWFGLGLRVHDSPQATWWTLRRLEVQLTASTLNSIGDQP